MLNFEEIRVYEAENFYLDILFIAKWGVSPLIILKKLSKTSNTYFIYNFFKLFNFENKY
jgi:hypothetical protein